MDLSLAGWCYVLALTALLPFLAIRGARRLVASGRLPTRRQYLLSVAISQGMMLILALVVARTDWVELFPAPTLSWEAVAAAGAFLAVSLGTVPMRWRWKDEALKRRMSFMLPRETRDLAWWAGVSLVAGVVEEIVYRGVLFALWMRLLGSNWWASVAVCVVAFALAHWVQGARTAAVIAVLSVAMHGLVRMSSGQLYLAMAVHALYDFFAGFLIVRLERASPTPFAGEGEGG